VGLTIGLQEPGAPTLSLEINHFLGCPREPGPWPQLYDRKIGARENFPHMFFLAAPSQRHIPLLGPVDGPFHIRLPRAWDDPFGAMYCGWLPSRSVFEGMSYYIVTVARPRTREGTVRRYIREMQDRPPRVCAPGELQCSRLITDITETKDENESR
jgi:hypothetical protein